MVTQKLIDSVKEFVYADIEKYGAPSKWQVDYANDMGQQIAGQVGVDKNIVLLGTWLMDCKLGQAYSEGRLQDHVEMSRQKAEEILAEDSEITEEEKQNVLSCVGQHHGVEKFDSKESEVCCNADCYKFASVRGVVGGIKHTRDMPMDDLVSLFLSKADEKWKALSLDICIQELKPEYEAIKEFLHGYSKRS